MANLSQLRELATRLQLDLTQPLSKREVEVLAEEWVPEMRFHEDENFHPLSVSQWLSPATSGGSAIRNEDRLITIAAHDPRTELSADPPVFFESRDLKIKREPDAPEITSLSYVSNVSELAGPASAFDPRDRSPRGMAQYYFGSKSEQNGVKLPRLSPMTIGAELRDLREALRFQASAYRAANDGNFPEDEQGVLLDAILGAPLFNADDAKPKHLDQLIQLVNAAYDADRGVDGAEAERKGLIKELEADGILSNPEWQVIQNFVFLEYYFPYAYNDISEHREWHEILPGNHEGDIEGVAVVFNRYELGRIVTRPDRERFLRDDLVPRFLVSSAHGPAQGLDQSIDLQLLRSLFGVSTTIGVPFTLADFKANYYKVWIMPGSHATFLQPGEYDNLEHIDEEVITPALIAVGVERGGPYAIPLIAILLLLEHLLSPDEETSDGGVHGILAARSGSSPAGRDIAIRLLTTPLSRHPENIYQSDWRPQASTEIDVPLSVRSFPGKWGVDGGSSLWNCKTARFVKKMAKTYFE